LSSENVAIIGASDKPERFSHKAMLLLQEYGHKVFLVSPRYQEIEGQKVYSDLSEISEKIDTVTMYVSERLQKDSLQQSIINSHPKRVIFNPGTENELFERKLAELKIEPQRACTLVLLRTGQY
tara:strand:- start:78 stop:449 length:372 start_codon:yes stop_codon:yes gene_type:complete